MRLLHSIVFQILRHPLWCPRRNFLFCMQVILLFIRLVACNVREALQWLGRRDVVVRECFATLTIHKGRPRHIHIVHMLVYH